VSIGWPTGNPFQAEVAWADLAGGLTGLLCAGRRDGFSTATAISSSVFSLGAGFTHSRELRRSGNLAINNAGAILPDLLTPASVLGLLWVHGRWSRGRRRRSPW
jgi:hypothetical protein